MNRASGFFVVLQLDPENYAQNIDGLHFMTESLFQLWKIIDNNHQPSKRNVALRSVYASPQEAKAYEDVLKAEVFDHVLGNCILNNIHCSELYFDF